MQRTAMKWDDLRVFLAVARHSGLQAAGRVLGLDPATVSRRVAALEAALGSKLFDRSPQGYALTEAGRSLMLHAQAMENVAAAAEEEAGGGFDTLSGTVRIGAPDGVSNYLLIDACDALSRDNPALQVRSWRCRGCSPVQARGGPGHHRLAPDGGAADRAQDRRLPASPLCAGRSGRRAGQDPGNRRPRAAAGIGYISDMIFDKELDYYALLGRETEPSLTSNSLIMQLRWCLRGCGLCILPDFVAREHPELAVVMPDDVRLTRSFYLVRHQDDARVARINRMAEVVVDWMRGRSSALATRPDALAPPMTRRSP